MPSQLVAEFEEEFVRRSECRAGYSAVTQLLHRLVGPQRPVDGFDEGVGGGVGRRYEHERPGDLIHVDVKKLARVPDGGGWRYVGNQQGGRNRSATAARTGEPKNKRYQPLIGTCYPRTVIDDHSCVAYVEARDDETTETATTSPA